jgi:xylan 1,4-beta-xylosidase
MRLHRFAASLLLASTAIAAAPPAPTTVPVAADQPPITLSADAGGPGRPLAHFWSTCVGAGRANEGLRASWLEQLRLVHDQCGFQYCRFHGLFHDDMFVYRLGGDGRPVYNFQYVDDLFDRMLAIGVRPFVELGFSPGDLATARDTTFWWHANGSPPNDYGKWADLVDHFVRHCRQRYGADEVRRWYFEVWNEPNLRGFFRGTQQQYFDLYAVTARAIKAVDGDLRVGGPATSNFHPRLGRVPAATQRADPTPADVEALDWQPVWVAEFLAFCHAHDLPVDFVSTHPYPQDFPFDDGHGGQVHVKRAVGATEHDLRVLRRIVDASPYPHAQIDLTEWSSSPSSRDFTHDCLPAAAFVVKTNLESAGLVDALSYWTFTDVFEEKGAGDTLFHGGFGLVNYQGIEKPAFHAYRFLNALGDELLAQPFGGVVTRDHRTGKVAVLAYHYPAAVPESLPTAGSVRQAQAMQSRGEPTPLAIDLTGLAPGAPFEVETLDADHGDAVAAWQAMGSPTEPTREQTATLRQRSAATDVRRAAADAAGGLHVRQALQPWTVVLVRQL